MKTICTLIIVLVLLLLGYYFSPQLLSWQARARLAELPCESIQYRLERPRWDRLRIHNLDVRDCSPAGLGSLRATLVELAFEPTRLMRERRLQQVRIQGLSLVLAPTAPAQSAALALAPLLPGAWLKQLPAERVEIELTSVQYPWAEQMLEASGALTLTPHTLRVQLNPIQSPFPLTGLDLDWGGDNRFELVLHKGAAPAPYRASGQLVLNTRGFRLTLEDRAELAWLQQWLAPQPGHLSGNLASQWQIDGPLQLDPTRWLPQLRARQTLQSDIELQADQGPIATATATVQGQIDWSDQGANWTLDSPSQVEFQLASAMQLAGTALPRHWRLRFEEGGRGRLAWAPEPTLVLEEGGALLQSLSAAALSAGAQINALHWTPTRSDLRFELSLTLKHWQAAAMTLDQLRASVQGEISLAGTRTELKLAPRGRVQAARWRQGGNQIDNLVMNNRKPILLQLSQAGAWELAAAAVEFTADRGRFGELTTGPLSGAVQLERLRSDAELAGQGTLSLAAKQIQQSPWTLPALSIEMPFLLNSPWLSFNARVQAPLANGNLQLNVKGRADLARQRLRANAELAPLALVELLPLLPESYRPGRGKLEQGSLSGTGVLAAGAQDWQLDTTMTLRDAHLTLPQWRLAPLDADIKMKLGSQQPHGGEAMFRIQRILGPITMQQFEARIAWQGSSARIDRGQVQLLGGQASIAPFDLDLQAWTGSTRLYLQRLSLAQIFQLHQQLSGEPFSPLSGEGLLSGILPLSWTQDSLTVTGGDIRALPPGGVLHYRPLADAGALAAGNPASALVMKVIENFQFKQLSSGIDYDPTGTLWLNNTLKGSNPEWQNGQPVILNIPIEYSGILGLYRALQYSDALIEKLTEKIQP